MIYLDEITQLGLFNFINIEKITNCNANNIVHRIINYAKSSKDSFVIVLKDGKVSIVFMHIFYLKFRMQTKYKTTFQ